MIIHAATGPQTASFPDQVHQHADAKNKRPLTLSQQIQTACKASTHMPALEKAALTWPKRAAGPAVWSDLRRLTRAACGSEPVAWH